MSGRPSEKSLWTPGGGGSNGVDIVVEVNKENQHILEACYQEDPCDEDDANIVEAFHAFDKDNDGFLNKDDIHKVLKCFGVQLTETELDDMIEMADMNEDGKIDYHEFARMMSMDSRQTTSLTSAAGQRSRQHTISNSASKSAAGQQSRQHTSSNSASKRSVAKNISFHTNIPEQN